MIQSASNYPLSVIFNPEQNLKYSIPKYQREYVWQQKHWEALFDDIWENEKGHFLGSIICINQSQDSHQTQRLELVDGQQRITTTSLLYAALYNSLKELVNDDDDDTKAELANVRNRLVQKSNKASMRLEPSLQGKNYADYQWILTYNKILNKELDRPLSFGKRRIGRAYHYFESRFRQEDVDGSPLYGVVELLAFLDKLNASSMVKIEVNSHADAFTLFETLNNRGEPLSALDLIKNKFLDVLEQKGISTIDHNFDIWTRLLENLTDDARTQQRYLRQYYNTFKYKPEVEVKGITKATRSNLISIFGKLIHEDVERIFNDLYAKSKIYGRLVKPDDEANSHAMTEALKDLYRIGGVPSLGFLMYLISEYPDIPSAELTKIIRLFARFFVRRNVTDTPPTRDLDKLFIEMTDYYQQQGINPNGDMLREFLGKPAWNVSEELFERKLRGNLYIDNTDATRFILCSIEASHQNNETQTDLWKRYDSGQFYWTIEHILPQGKNIPSEWVEMIAQGNSVKAIEMQENYVHQLGNLTISGYNTTLGNLSFDKKRDRRDNKGNFVGYKNSLYLNRELANRDSWEVEAIEERTDLLVRECLGLFTL